MCEIFQIIVAGEKQNVGKTTFITNFIKQNKNKKIIAIKISHHFHNQTSMPDIKKDNEFEIYQEISTNKNKDSNKMLEAGAETVFYIQSKKNKVLNAYKSALSLINIKDYDLIICESGELTNYIKPNFFVYIKSIE